MNKVETGTRLVGDAGKTMDEVVASVQRVTGIMAEISAASHEQSAGIAQVSQAVAQMDEVTQQNAALVEEAAAAAESMEEQARSLAVSVWSTTLCNIALACFCRAVASLIVACAVARSVWISWIVCFPGCAVSACVIRWLSADICAAPFGFVVEVVTAENTASA